MGKKKRRLMPMSVGAVPELKAKKQKQKEADALAQEFWPDPFLASSASEVERMAACGKPLVVLQPEEFELVGIREPDGTVRPLKKPESSKPEAQKSKSKGVRETITINSTAAFAASAAGSTRAKLVSAKELASKGKYGKVLETLQDANIPGLVNAFLGKCVSMVSMNDVIDDIQILLVIAKTVYEYDSKGRRVITDGDYDQIITRWRTLGLDEPSGVVTTSKKVPIKYETLHNNMDKAYTLRSDDPLPAGVKESDSIEDFLDRVYTGLDIKPNAQIRIAVSPKIDGVSVNGTVKGNLLVDPQTRGDESASMRIIGMDKMAITDIDPEGEFGIQFECFLTDSDMAAVQGVLGRDEEYANNRNAVAGLVSRLCTSDIPEILPYLSFYPIETEGLDMDYVDRIEFLENFRIVPQDMLPTEIITGDFNFLLNRVQEIFEHYDNVRGQLSYNIDGLVITVADDVNQQILGRKGRTNLYQIALKFDPENALGVVDHIEMDCGRKGYRTPQVYLTKPVILGGAKYDHVPILSANLFEQLGLKIGSVVNVHRVGDVIPSITVVEAGDGQELSISGDCPICGEPMVVRNSKMFCSNPNCSSNKTGRILSLFEGIKLDGYSDSFVDELRQKSGDAIATPGDLLEVDEEYLTAIGMTGKVEQRFPALFEAAMKRSPDYVILGSYGIPDLGRARARDLLKSFGSLFNFIYTYENEGVEGLNLGETLGRIGEKIEEFFNTYPDTTEEIFKSLTAYMNADYMRLTENFDQMIRVGHTGGELSEDVEELCNALGYEIVDGSGFDILITGSYDSNSTKMNRAKRKELPIFTQDDFLKEYGNQVA